MDNCDSRLACLPFSLAVLFAFATPAIATPLTPADTKAVNSAILAAFARYKTQTSETADWDLPIWSASLTIRIAEWRLATAHLDFDEMSEAGWLCQCQDWDAKGFKVTSQTASAIGTAKVQVKVAFTPGWGEKRNARFLLIREKGRWKVDDLFSADNPDGVRAGLTRAIADAKTAAN